MVHRNFKCLSMSEILLKIPPTWSLTKNNKKHHRKSKHKCPSLKSLPIQFVVVVKIPRTQWPYYFTDLYWLRWRSVRDFGKEKWKVCLFQADSMFILFTYDI